MRSGRHLALVVGLGLVVLLGGGAPPTTQPARPAVDFSPVELRRILQHSPLPPPPPDPTNRWADDPAAAALGQTLFFDERLSGNGKLSCASCHEPARSFTDGKAVAEGVGVGTRNTPSLWNAAYQRWYFWDGRADTLWGQALHPLERDVEMDGDRVHVLRVVQGDAELSGAYEALFGPLPSIANLPAHARPMPDAPAHPQERAWRGLTAEEQSAVTRVFVNCGKAIAAYERKLVSRRAAFDVFVEGLRENDAEKLAALSPAAQRGLQLFVGRGNCRFCHVGPNFTDDEFHSVRVAPRGGGAPTDAGRYVGAAQVLGDPFNAISEWSDSRSGPVAEQLEFLANPGENWGRFKTPSLRNVARTGPYMHAGQYSSLDQVLRHYSTFLDALPPGHHGQVETILQPLALSPQEHADLRAFLEALTDEDVPAALLRQPSRGDDEPASGGGAVSVRTESAG